jgi:cytochrome P450
MRFLLEQCRGYGEVVSFSVLGEEYLLAASPRAIREVLIDNARRYRKSRDYDGVRLALGQGLFTSEGVLWRSQRKLMQPAFARDRVAACVDRMVDLTLAMLERWGTLGEVDVSVEMQELALRIVADALFGQDASCWVGDIQRALGFVIRFAYEYSETPLRIPTSWPLPRNVRFKRAMADLERVAGELVARARALPPDRRPPLLAMLMGAVDEETREPMTERQLRDEVLTLLLAGHETTASALAFALCELARSSPAFEDLRRDALTLACDRPTFAQLAGLSAPARVFQETLRLHPPVWFIGREALEDDTVAGVRVPRGAVVAVCPYALHRDPDLWPDADRFDPDRFLPDRERGRERFAYIPFGAGPRLCLGNHFAITEASVVLALTARRFRLRAVPGRHIEHDIAISLRPRGAARIAIESAS